MTVLLLALLTLAPRRIFPCLYFEALRSGRTSIRSREVLKPRDSGLGFSNRSEIRQALRQHRFTRFCCKKSARLSQKEFSPVIFTQLNKTFYDVYFGLRLTENQCQQRGYLWTLLRWISFNNTLSWTPPIYISPLKHSEILPKIQFLHMGQVTELWLSCYLVLLSNDSKTR